MKKVLILALAIVLSACASQVDVHLKCKKAQLL